MHGLRCTQWIIRRIIIMGETVLTFSIDNMAVVLHIGISLPALVLTGRCVVHGIAMECDWAVVRIIAGRRCVLEWQFALVEWHGATDVHTARHPTKAIPSPCDACPR